MDHEQYRSGFVAFVGRPNVGKSTLMNALVGDKVAITSSKPQTTRKAIRGIVTSDSYQLVLVDTPGVHRPRTLLGRRLNELVQETLAEVDVIGVCVPADQKIGPGDRYIIDHVQQLRAHRTHPAVIAIVTKADLVSREELAEQLLAVHESVNADEIVPISALEGEQLGVLQEVIASRMPLGGPLYPEEQLTEESERDRIAEFVREAALEGVRDELPHSVAVVVDELVEEDPNGDVFAEVAPGTGRLVARISLYVERDSQKGIIIGKGGQRLKEVGTRARMDVKRLLGRPVHLDIRVKVAKDWQRDPKQLRRLGF